MYRKIILASLVACAPFLGMAMARANIIDTRSIAVPNAPIAVTNCKYDAARGEVSADIQNRTSYSLMSFDVAVKYYDASDTLIGSNTWHHELNARMDSGDMENYLNTIWTPRLSEPRALSYVTCRVESASFMGKKNWRYGQHWKDKLLPLQSNGGK